MAKRLFLVFGIAISIGVLGCTAVAVVGVAAVGVAVVSVALGVVALAFQDAVVQFGPESDSWPVQPTDAPAAAVLGVGKQTESRRTSVNIEATGSYVDQFFGGEKVRVQFRWRKPNVVRIDVSGARKEPNGAHVPIRRTFIRPNNDEFWCYDHSAKTVDVFEWLNADQSMQALNLMRWEPLPWFFPSAHDVIQRRWKIETVGPVDGGVKLSLKPANERWKMEGDVWLDPKSGMPKKLSLVSRFAAWNFKGDVDIERLEENAPIDAEVFQPWTPDPKEGWQINRHDMGQKEGAEEAVKILGPNDKSLAMTEPKQ
jgi:outer membrane lipoprotein-sorting protein